MPSSKKPLSHRRHAGIRAAVEASIRASVDRAITPALIDQITEEVAGRVAEHAREAIAGIVGNFSRPAARQRDSSPDNYPPSKRLRDDRAKPQKNGKGAVVCRKCGFVGGNSRGCGRAHPTQGKPETTGGDDDGEGEGPRPRSRGLEARAPELDDAPALDPGDRREVIAARATVLARRADDVTPTLPIAQRRDPHDRREVCAIHGWVGRARFVAEHHDACEVERLSGKEPCRDCGGTGLSGVDFCDRCGGAKLEEAYVPDVGVHTERDVPSVAEPHRLEVTKREVEWYDDDGRHHRNNLAARAKDTVKIPKTIWGRAAVLEDSARLADDIAELESARPRVRGDCVGAERPCAFAGCRYNLLIDVSPETGALSLVHGHDDVDRLEHSCALDIADDGGRTLAEIGALMSVTRERVRQLELKALHRAKAVTHLPMFRDLRSD